MRAFEAAADPAQYPEAGEPWQISKLYYDRIMNSQRVNAMHAASLVGTRIPRCSTIWTRSGAGCRSARISRRPRCESATSSSIATTRLRAHASQVAPDSSFFFWPNDLQREVWPWEDFQLVRSSVPSTLPETDLFAGIMDPQEGEQ